MNYIISAFALLLTVLLFIKSVLPRSVPPLTVEDEINPKALEFKLTVLAINSVNYKRRGGGLNLSCISKPINRLFKSVEKKCRAGSVVHDFERRIYVHKRQICEALSEVEKACFSFYSLPHCNKYPRLYDFCSMLIKFNGGYIDSELLNRGAEIFNEHSPFLFSEITAMKAMLQYCLLEQIAILCSKSALINRIANRAQSDADREKIDLTYLKYNTYIYAYYNSCDFDSARKFAAICLENDVDVHLRCRDYAVKCSRYSALAQGALSCMVYVRGELTEKNILALYSNYEQFMNTPSLGFSMLSVQGQYVYLNAFAGKCRQKKLNETVEGSRVISEGGSIDEEFLPNEPNKYIIGLTFAAAIIMSFLPSVFSLFFLDWRGIVASVLLLPISLGVVVIAARSVMKTAFRSLYLPLKAQSEQLPANYAMEISADNAVCENADKSVCVSSAVIKKEKQSAAFKSLEKAALTPRLNAFEAVCSRLQRTLSLIIPSAALGLTLVAPLISSWLIAAAYAPEIVAFMNALRLRFKEGKRASKNIATPVFDTLFLPKRAVLSIIGNSASIRVKRTAGLIAQLSAAVVLVLTVLFTRGSLGFYAVAAVYAAAPVLAKSMKATVALFEKRRKAETVLPDKAVQTVHEQYGIYPHIHFIVGGEYSIALTERAEGFDCYCKVEFLKNTRIFAQCGERREQLKFILPFVTQSGRVILNAVGLNRTFSVEITALGDGGKAITVKAHGGGDFLYWCVHETTGQCEKCADDDLFAQNYNAAFFSSTSNRAKTFFAAACKKTTDFNVITDAGEFLYDSGDDCGSIVAVSTLSHGGTAEFIFTADCNLIRLRQKTACAFKNGFLARSHAQSISLAEHIPLTPALAEAASYIYAKKCCYSDASLVRYLDLRFFTLLFYLKSGKGISRLYGKLKGLSVLKRLGLRFNIAVLAFENAAYFTEIESKVNLIFDEFALNTNGKACCINCEGNPVLYACMKEAGVNYDTVRFKKYDYNPQVKCCKRKSADFPVIQTLISGENSAVTTDGDGLYFPYGKAALAENCLGAKDGTGCVLRADGSSFTFIDSPLNGKLTERTHSLSNIPSEFIAFSERGCCWSATLLPLGVRSDVMTRHSENFTCHLSVTNGFVTEQTVFLVDGSRTKLTRIKISNKLKQSRCVSVLAYIKPSLGVNSDVTAHMLKYFTTNSGVAAVNVVSGKSVYLSVNRAQFSQSFNFCGITDEKGDIVKISGIKDDGEKNSLMLSTDLKLPPLGEDTIYFAVSDNADYDFSDADSHFTAATDKPRKTCSFKFCSSDKLNDLFFNRLALQAKASLLCNTGFGKEDGKDGFASTLIKGCAALLYDVSLSRKIVLNACSRRFLNGDILLYKYGDRGERAYRHSGALFLPIAVAKYIDFTDDRDLLFERVAFLQSGGSAGSNVCRPSYKKASVLEHCLQSINGCLNDVCCDCMNIDYRLLLLYAINKFLPLTADDALRLDYADKKTRLTKELKQLNADELTAVNLSWLILCGVIPNGSAVKLLTDKLADDAQYTPTEKLWLCCALSVSNQTQKSYDLLCSLNPLKSQQAMCEIIEDGLYRPLTDETAAIAALFVTEGLFGCRKKGDCIIFSPALPPSIKSAYVEFRFDKNEFGIEIDNSSDGKWCVSVNDISYNVNSLALTNKLNGKKISLIKR